MFNKNYIFLILSIFFLIGCEKKPKLSLDFLNKPQAVKNKSAPVSSIKKSTSDTKKLKKIKTEALQAKVYTFQTSGFFQRGFTFIRINQKTIMLAPVGPVSSVFISDGKRHLSISLKDELTASIEKVGLSGIVGNISKNLKEYGADIYLITKKLGLDPKLIIVPRSSHKQRISLPKSYIFSSEPLWYIFVFKDEIKNFRIRRFSDFGDGLNHYHRNTPYHKIHGFSLKKILEPKEIKGILEKVPKSARYVILDVTVVLKKMAKRGFLDIFFSLNDGGRLTIDRIMLLKSKEEKVYKRTIKVPFYNSGLVAIERLTAVLKDVSYIDPKDGHVYIYVKGWKIVNHF